MFFKYILRCNNNRDLTDTSISFPDFFTKRNKFVHILRISSATVQLSGGGGGIPTKIMLLHGLPSLLVRLRKG
jgi:hypothetical protein